MTTLTLFDTSMSGAEIVKRLDAMLAVFDGEGVHSLVRQLRCRADGLEPIEPGFRAEVIYLAYPRKEGRGAALKAIEKALRKIDASELQAAVEEYATAVETWPAWERGQDDGSGHEVKDIRPHCSTWMNQERWADDRSEWYREAAGGNLEWMQRKQAEESAANATAAVGFLTGPAVETKPGQVIDATCEVVE